MSELRDPYAIVIIVAIAVLAVIGLFDAPKQEAGSMFEYDIRV
jgi:hypothetical protein